MTKPRKRFTGTWLAAILLGGLWGGPAHADAQSELQALRAQEAALQRGLDRTLRDRSQAENALRLAEDRVARAGRAVVRLKARERRVQAAANALQARQAALQVRERKERRMLARQAVAAYESSQGGPVRLFFAGQSPQFVARMMTYYGYVLRARVHRLRAVHKTASDLAKVAAALSLKRHRLKILVATEAAQEAKLDAALSRRARIVRRLTGEAHHGRQDLIALQRRARRLQALLRGLRRLPKITARIPDLKGPFWRFRGRLPLPIPARYAAIRRGFGPGGLGRWGGVVIPGPVGETVRAVFSGRVVYANWLRGYGLLVILQNGDGYMTLYGHNQALLVRVGETVRGGEAIATVGDSGGFSRPGLYFDISHDGQPLNPLIWLAH